MTLWLSRLRIGLTAAALAIAMCSVPGWCRQSTQNSNTTASPPAKNSPAENNPFPLAQSQAVAKATKTSGQSNAASSRTESTKSQKAPSPAAQQNPFPEAQSEAAAKSDDNENQPQTANQPSGYSSSNAQLPDADLGQGSMNTPEKMDTFTRDHTLDGRIEDDLNVADLYMKNGNYKGALLRYQDAVQYDPQNDTALFGIAEATCKLNRTGDAMTLLQAYAKNHPQGKYALKAEKLIAHPNKCMHNW